MLTFRLYRSSYARSPAGAFKIKVAARHPALWRPCFCSVAFALSLLLCRFCSVAFALSLLFREGALKPAAPAIFLLVIILVAHFSGRLASLLVAILGGLVFASFLFRPYGRFAV